MSGDGAESWGAVGFDPVGPVSEVDCSSCDTLDSTKAEEGDGEGAGAKWAAELTAMISSAFGAE